MEALWLSMENKSFFSLTKINLRECPFLFFFCEILNTVEECVRRIYIAITYIRKLVLYFQLHTTYKRLNPTYLINYIHESLSGAWELYVFYMVYFIWILNYLLLLKN